MNRQSLVISALGEDQPGIVDAVSKAVLEHHCSIADSRMAVLGGEFAIILRVTGNRENVVALQQSLPGLQESLGLTLISKLTTERRTRNDRIPYRVTAVSLDHPGIVQRIAEFFARRSINIEDLKTDSYPAAHTGTPLFRITMCVHVPADQRLPELRDQFAAFCDELNIDMDMEQSDRL